MNTPGNTPEHEKDAHEAVPPELDDEELLQPETRGPNYDRMLAVAAGVGLIFTGAAQIREGDVFLGASMMLLGGGSSFGGSLIELDKKS